MRIMINRMATVLGLAAWLSSTSSAWCFYNPQTGRWLNRDRIVESGGLNLYAHAQNSGINRVDPFGLLLYYEPPSFPAPSVAEIRATTGNPTALAYTECFGPVTRGEGEFEEKVEHGTYCARIKKAKEIVVNLKTVFPSDWSDYMTEQGAADTAAHEWRRVDAVTRGFNTFLKPAELTGALALKCGWLCCCTKGLAKKRLQHYMNDLRGAAYYGFRTYVDGEWYMIDIENRHPRPPVIVIEIGGGGGLLYDGTEPEWVHTVRDPGRFDGIPCKTCSE